MSENGNAQGFCGVSGDGVIAVGRVGVAGGALEWVAHCIALELGVAPKHQLSTILRNVKGSLHKIPEFATIAASELAAWCDDSLAAMDARNRVLHAGHFTAFEAEGWVEVAEHLRSGDRNTVARIEDLAERLRRLVKTGHIVHEGLLRQVKPGVYLKHRRHERDGFVLINSGDDPQFPRPSNEEMLRWWDEYGPV